MSLLDNIVSQVLKNSLGDAAQQPSQSNTGIGSLLGKLMGGDGQVSSEGTFKQILNTQLGGNNNQIATVLGSLLGNQTSNVGAGQLGQVLGQVLGNQKQQGFSKSALLVALLPVVLGYIQKNGGLSGVLSQLQAKGLGDYVQRWVSSDANKSDTSATGLTLDSVKGLFGREEIASVCSKTGASETEVCQGLADLLPKIINDLTPEGSLANEQRANQEVNELLSQFQATVSS